jgi:hypothetical protein
MILEDFRERALAWLDGHRDRFRLRHATGPAERLPALKRLTELGTVATVAANRSPVAAELAELAWRELGRGVEIADALELAPALAIGYLPFRLAGLRSRKLEAQLTRSAWRRDWQTWPLFVRYGVGTVLESIGIAPCWSQQRAYAGLEVFQISRGPWLPFAIHAEVCAHVVLWRTAMGRSWAALSSSELHAMEPWTRAVAGTLSEHGLLDPLAEVLAASACVRGSFFADGWRTLLGGQRADGAVPLQVGAASDEFDDLYHGTLASALAATLVTAPRPVQVTSNYFAHYAS